MASARLQVVLLIAAGAACNQILDVDHDYVLAGGAGATSSPTTGGADGGAGTAGMGGAAGTGGDAGMAGTGGTAGIGGTAGGECGVDPPPPGGACPAICDQGCANDVCHIRCNGSACNGRDLTCPDGFACDVTCSNCGGATITCPETHACNVSCEGYCLGTEVVCSATGTCKLDCPFDNDACQGATLTCGDDACEASCPAGGPVPTVDCGDACACTGC